MKKKVLFAATVDSHITYFHLPYLRCFKEKDYEVHVVTGEAGTIPFCDQKHSVSMHRSPFKFISNVKALIKLKKIMEKEQYDLVSCHTPVGGVVARLAAKEVQKKGTKVIYTAHGFHFYKGAPFIYWLFYYPIEKYLAKYTDCLVTINEEDYQTAICQKFGAGQIKRINGIGVDLAKFKAISRDEKERLKVEYGFAAEDFILTYVAELNKNKNQQMIIRSLKVIKRHIPQVKLLLIGEDCFNRRYQKLAKRLGLQDQVCFLGKREDVNRLLQISDLYVASSKREGLPVNVVEAAMTGLPICATKIRGHIDLLQGRENCLLVKPDSMYEFIHGIRSLYNSIKENGSTKENDSTREYNRIGYSPRCSNAKSKYLNKDMDKYDIERTLVEMSKIYEEWLNI